jgi:hypothetical protein
MVIKINKKLFFKIASDDKDLEVQVIPNEDILRTNADIFSFYERTWCWEDFNDNPWKVFKIKDNVALLSFTTYSDWLAEIINKTHHNPVKRASNKGIKTIEVSRPDESFAVGVWKIYHETPIRQGRKFYHYDEKLDDVKSAILNKPENYTFIGAYFGEELVGFIELIFGENVTIISQILSLTKHFDKNVNKAMIAKAVQVCEERSVEDDRVIIYGRMGNHPSLDKFKEENGFIKYSINRCYIPLTRKGRLAVQLGFHREVKDVIPNFLKGSVIPIYNWFNRNFT